MRIKTMVIEDEEIEESGVNEVNIRFFLKTYKYHSEDENNHGEYKESDEDEVNKDSDEYE